MLHCEMPLSFLVLLLNNHELCFRLLSIFLLSIHKRCPYLGPYLWSLSLDQPFLAFSFSFALSPLNVDLEYITHLPCHKQNTRVCLCPSDGRLDVLAGFYPRDAMLARVIAIATCPSVCVSVTRRYCVTTKKASGMISSPSGSPKTLVF